MKVSCEQERASDRAFVNLTDSFAKSASSILPLDAFVFRATLDKLSIAFSILLIKAPNFALSLCILCILC